MKETLEAAVEVVVVLALTLLMTAGSCLPKGHCERARIEAAASAK